MPKTVRAFCPGKNPIEMTLYSRLDFILDLIDQWRLDKVLGVCIRLQEKPNLPTIQLSVG